MDANQLGSQPTTVNTTSRDNTTQSDHLASFSDALMPPIPRVVQPSAREIKTNAREHQRKLLENWIPRELSADEIEEHRLVTQKYINTIRALEAIQASSLAIIPKIEWELFKTRLHYRTLFGRIFRINDLPTEILTNIFHLVAWSIEGSREAVVSRTHLVSVCRHWRTVAIRDNTLWNAMWFLPPNYNSAFLSLERAGNATLDIRINDSEEHPLTRESTPELIDKIFKRASSIRVFIVMVQDWEPALLFLHKFKGVAEENIPMCLERFEIRRTGLTVVEPGPGFTQELLNTIPLFGGAKVSSLRSLVADGVHIDWDKSYLANLTNLTISRHPVNKSPTLERFQKILRLSPDLISLVINAGGPQWSPNIDFRDLQPVNLPKLKSLLLGGFSLHYGIFVARTISTPNVVDLTLNTINGNDPDFHAFFSRLTSMPLIVSLSLYNIGALVSPIQTFAVFSWLKSIPRVTYLRLHHIHESVLNLFLHDTNGTFDPAQTDSLICPKVLYLELPKIPDPNPIIQVFRKRKMLGYPLRKIYIYEEALNKFIAESPSVILSLQELVGRENVGVLRPGIRPSDETNLFQ